MSPVKSRGADAIRVDGIGADAVLAVVERGIA